MALANFFDRAAMAASQVLAGFDVAAFSATLDQHVIGIAIDGNAVGTLEGRSTIDMCVRLVSRLYPAIAIWSLADAAMAAVDEAVALARSINPAIDVREPGGVTACIVVGSTTPTVDCPTVFTGSDGWIARLSDGKPVGSGDTDVPFGAGAAACFAVANVFRIVFRDQLAGGDPDREMEVSLLTYGHPGDAAWRSTVVDLVEGYLVGAGAIGNGAAWALARCHGLRGRLNVIDHEAIDLSNLQRYVMACQEDVGAQKAGAAVRHFAGTGLEIVPHASTWTEYVAARGDWRFESVAVALDTGRDRIDVQAALPRWIANAWTQDLDLGVSRHQFGDGRACLACLYMPTGTVKNEHERLADELRMPEAVMDIKAMLQRGLPVDKPFLHRVAAAMEIPVEPLMRFVGRPLREFHQAAICGGLAFTLTGGVEPVRAVVPMSFQSALAGIMLAAEMVKHAAGWPEPAAVSTRINLLRPLGQYLYDPIAPDPSGRCICKDPDFKAAYKLKYASSRAT